MPLSPERCDRRVKEIISTHLNIDILELSNEQSFVDDLGADSLDIVEMLMSLEEEFTLDITDEQAEKLLTVDDVIRFVKTHVN